MHRLLTTQLPFVYSTLLKSNIIISIKPGLAIQLQIQ